MERCAKLHDGHRHFITGVAFVSRVAHNTRDKNGHKTSEILTEDHRHESNGEMTCGKVKNPSIDEEVVLHIPENASSGDGSDVIIGARNLSLTAE